MGDVHRGDGEILGAAHREGGAEVSVQPEGLVIAVERIEPLDRLAEVRGGVRDEFGTEGDQFLALVEEQLNCVPRFRFASMTPTSSFTLL